MLSAAAAGMRAPPALLFETAYQAGNVSGVLSFPITRPHLLRPAEEIRGDIRMKWLLCVSVRWYA